MPPFEATPQYPVEASKVSLSGVACGPVENIFIFDGDCEHLDFGVLSGRSVTKRRVAATNGVFQMVWRPARRAAYFLSPTTEKTPGPHEPVDYD